MTSARDEVLARIHLALRDAPAAHVVRDYQGATGQQGSVDLFAERLADYRATVRRVPSGAVASSVEELLQARGSHSVVVPAGVPDSWLPATLARSVVVLRDAPALSHTELDRAGSVLTGCSVAIAETGTLILTHGAGQGRRALTLLPDHHVVVVRAAQVVPGVVDAVALLEPHLPMTWISGPSATSDIELSRVEGVHGPRCLDVIVVENG